MPGTGWYQGLPPARSPSGPEPRRVPETVVVRAGVGIGVVGAGDRAGVGVGPAGAVGEASRLAGPRLGDGRRCGAGSLAGDGVGRGAGGVEAAGPGVALLTGAAGGPCPVASALVMMPPSTARTAATTANSAAIRCRRRLSPRRITSAGGAGRAWLAAFSASCRRSSPSSGPFRSGTGHLRPLGWSAASLRYRASAARPRASLALTVPSGTPVSAAICATLRSHR